MTSIMSCCLCAINYRPISLTCIACKLMEHIITSHIMKHADTHNILYPLQHETQLIECVDDITRNIDAGKQTDCLIMDFSKAFDKVTHSLLQHKLDHYDIRGKPASGSRPSSQTEANLSLLKESHQIRYRCNRERKYPKTQS